MLIRVSDVFLLQGHILRITSISFRGPCSKLDYSNKIKIKKYARFADVHPICKIGLPRFSSITFEEENKRNCKNENCKLLKLQAKCPRLSNHSKLGEALF